MSERKKKQNLRREVALWQALAAGFAVCAMLWTVGAVAAVNYWDGQRQELKPGEAPVVSFQLGDDKAVAVYAYCNLHGLWMTEV